MNTSWFSLPKLEPVPLNISKIESSCWKWRVSKTNHYAGCVEFRGTYRYGSAGSNDALYIRWTLNSFCDVAYVSGLVVDLRGLAYEWGDNLSIWPYSLRERGAPIRVIVSPEHQQAYNYVIDTEEMTTSEAEAYMFVRDAIRAPKAR